ncbi:regulator of chromosome condensation 1/beta-lactamase-inhibitor protein II [Circinella umbellata]|nr:regulator of chromosome condensation 1/beta-lactamase-inhibitor protein II [Circinella umbellata]
MATLIMSQPQRSLYSFGFNAFNQTSSQNNEDPILQYTQTNVNNVLFASWESTIITKDDNQLEMWGWIPESCSENNDFSKTWENQKIKRIFGPIDLGWIGVIDYNNILWYYNFNSKNKKKLAINIKDADYCQSREEIYILTDQGFVDCYQLKKEQDDLFTFKKRFSIPKVYSMAISFSHVIFYIQEGTDPIFGLNSNRYSQLGFDTTTIQHVDDEPIPIDFFSGLMVQKEASVACNSFHSAVVIDGELYTFGWKKSGRLGRSVEVDEDDIIGLAEFRDNENQVVEDVYVIKVVCGINHTMVLDDQGQIWTCGSNQYKQLGRTTDRENEESPYDDVFRLCTAYTGLAVDCFAGRWNSFVITQTPQS